MSIKVKIYNQEGEVIGEQELSERIFGMKANLPLLHQVMVAQTANRRQVLAHTKGRSEVRGGGRKPWRQKGTGRARAGSSRSPIWIGGGVTFGPTKDRNFKKKINQKMKRKAIFMVLSDRLRETGLAIIDEIITGDFKTKTIDNFVKRIETKVFNQSVSFTSGKKAKSADKIKSVDKAKNVEKVKDVGKAKSIGQKKRSILIISDSKDEKLTYSTRNLAGVKLINSENINVLDLLKYRNLIITAPAVKRLEEVYNK
jgi:large subunit ribosomal protein L4